MMEKPLRKSIINNGGNRKNQPFVNAVIKFQYPDTFIQANDRKEGDQSVKKILLFYLWQETTKEMLSKRSGTNSDYKNINNS